MNNKNNLRNIVFAVLSVGICLSATACVSGVDYCEYRVRHEVVAPPPPAVVTTKTVVVERPAPQPVVVVERPAPRSAVVERRSEPPKTVVVERRPEPRKAEPHRQSITLEARPADKPNGRAPSRR